MFGSPDVIDPLAEVVTLLQPGASFSKIVAGAGRWRVHRSEAGRPFYCVLLDGSCRLAVCGGEETTLEPGDFVLIPSAYDFTMSSLEPSPAADAATHPVEISPGEFRIGCHEEPPDLRALIGYCVFGSSDATLLVSLLPQLVHVRGEGRLATLVQLVDAESRQRRPGREVIVAHLLEVILIEALRSLNGTKTSPGLVRGLGDERLAIALRSMHERPTHPWTVEQLARETALSRSAFFERFRRTVGVAPMEYLLHWRMALAQDLLRREDGGVAEVAARVGYSSASTFSVAFSRHVGRPPMRYAREQRDRSAS